ncbi:uncharacterized protein LODBEIA_P07940 [Lodderomyces beijingensis]|uniref:Nitrogen regulatory protein areA GATA-like domain-containing protein n=1 Tax=Lodderomyces beijingensis TaxID=1775926 RepID=A0ABP0ZJU6_9ASCO
MLYALATPNSAFKPSIRKMKNTWRLQQFKKYYLAKGGANSSSAASSPDSSIASSHSSRNSDRMSMNTIGTEAYSIPSNK